ncbi:NAD-dependent epimerase/dehydratase family protein [Candidatus Woesearchaeota archaeon]|nr:MAG: NAD-dependent epimerase/dehydratase family protein [Candidatus Woesearchaeota archaeon]
MARVLVTGGAGFIGSHCIDSLLARRDSVICVDNFNDYYDPKKKRLNIKDYVKSNNYSLVVSDVADYKSMRSVFEKHKPDKVLHLAARAGVRASLKDPLEYVRSNVNGTATLLECAREFDVRDFVFASSSSVYGANKKVPFSEDDPVEEPVSPYAATKRMCEVLASNYSRMGLRIAALRFFTVYGPRNRPDMAIYKFAKSIVSGEELTVYGKCDEVKRDWTFIEDIVQGTLAVLDNVHRFSFEVFNLGNCKPEPVIYLVKLLEKNLKMSAKVRRAPLPAVDVPITYADTSKMERLLRWRARTPLEEGVERFCKWYLSQG